MIRWLIHRVRGSTSRLTKQLWVGSEDERIEAAARLSVKGRRAQNAIPLLMKALEDDSPRVRIAAAGAIASISRDPVEQKFFDETLVMHVAYGSEPALREIIRDESLAQPLRAIAAGLLAHIDPKSNAGILRRDGVGVLSDLLSVSEQQHAVGIIRLCLLGVDAIPALSPVDRVRLFATVSLRAIGPAANAALPQLHSVRDDSATHPHLRRSAAAAVQCIEAPEQEV